MILIYCACLTVALTECGDPPFRCEKCTSKTELRYMPHYDGKKMVYRWRPFTVWGCQDSVYHERRKAELKRMKHD